MCFANANNVRDCLRERRRHAILVSVGDGLSDSECFVDSLGDHLCFRKRPCDSQQLSVPHVYAERHAVGVRERVIVCNCSTVAQLHRLAVTHADPKSNGKCECHSLGNAVHHAQRPVDALDERNAGLERHRDAQQRVNTDAHPHAERVAYAQWEQLSVCDCVAHSERHRNSLADSVVGRDCEWQRVCCCDGIATRRCEPDDDTVSVAYSEHYGVSERKRHAEHNRH